MPDTADLTDEEVDDFTKACNRLYALMHRNRSSLAATATGPDQLSDSQLVLLTPLTEQGAMAVGKLATRAGVAQPTATRALKQLEDRGFVARKRISGDDRTVLVTLTPRGESAWQAADNRMRTLQRHALDQIPPERRTTVVDALTELARAIDRTG
ncbi:MarR family transcriptional regulator [Umezawaea sp.]|uniref:MarR family winged helix-turn-helix transcriptional regulator n=1 Tax=Umezawaea sp. TaxID=1955258 RepID=UPI002ED409D3